MAAVITIAYGDRKRLITNLPSYPHLLRSARKVFPQLKDIHDEDLTVLFKPEWETGEVELDASAYTVFHHRALLHFVMTVTLESCERQPTENRKVFFLKDPTTERITIYVNNLQGRAWKLGGIKPSSTVRSTTGKPITLAESNITHNSVLKCVIRLVGGKPAIYLLSPQAINKVSVSVELSREWDFTVIYPLADKSQSSKFSASKVTWNVSVDSTGILREASGREYSYLFWEAETQPATPMIDDEMYNRFNAARPLLTSSNSVVLPFHDFIGYLEMTLERLQLTVSMRTDFMTYWMPKFLHIRDQGLDIAVTFVEQSMFNKAARLSITPQPSTVARGFMLFGAVDNTERDENDSEWRNLRIDLKEANDID